MKKVLLVLALMIGGSSIAQSRFQFIDKEYFTASLAIDPGATVKEKSPNLVGQIQLVSNWGYVKANIQILPDLEGGYTDIAGGVGINTKWGDWRHYGGIRGGVIKRYSNTYPLFGFEGGVDYSFNDNMYVGARGTLDWREDFKASGAEPAYQPSFYLEFGVKWDWKKHR